MCLKLFLESFLGCFLCKSEKDQNHTHVKGINEDVTLKLLENNAPHLSLQSTGYKVASLKTAYEQ